MDMLVRYVFASYITFILQLLMQITHFYEFM